MMATYHVTSISYLVNGHVQFNFLQMQARLQAQQVRCVVRFVQLPVQFIISFIKPALKKKKSQKLELFHIATARTGCEHMEEDYPITTF